MASNLIYIQGDKYNIIFSPKKFVKPNVLMIGDELHIFLAEDSPHSYHEVLANWLKKQAKIYIFKRVKELAVQYEFEYKRISIRDQNTRWGSCSSLKNLNFSWRLYLAPVDVCDYVIIHELAHTKQMNHSSAFWDIVKAIMPGYKNYRLWLKENGRALKVII